MNLYIVRHGKTQWNIERRLQGVTDTDLHPEGFEDAKVMAKYLKDKGIQKIYSSPLRRTMDTANTINQALKVEIYKDSRLVERDFRGYSGCFVEDFLKLSSEEKNSVESIDEVVERGMSFYQESLKGEKNPVLVVTHGGLLGIILGYLGLSEPGGKIFHRCIYHIFDQEGEIKLEILDLNEYDHQQFSLEPVENDERLDTVLKIYQSQPEYFEKTSCSLPSMNDVLRDRIEKPAGISDQQKKYRLIYYKEKAVGIIDYVVNFPEEDTVYIGLLLMNRNHVESINGTQFMKWFTEKIKEEGFKKIQLGVVEVNKRAYHFWTRLGFKKIKEKQVEMGNVHHLVHVLEIDIVE